MSNDTIMAQLYGGGFSLREVAAILGEDRKTVTRRLKAQGVTLRPSNNVKRSEWLTKQEALEV